MIWYFVLIDCHWNDCRTSIDICCWTTYPTGRWSRYRFGFVQWWKRNFFHLMRYRRRTIIIKFERLNSSHKKKKKKTTEKKEKKKFQWIIILRVLFDFMAISYKQYYRSQAYYTWDVTKKNKYMSRTNYSIILSTYLRLFSDVDRFTYHIVCFKMNYSNIRRRQSSLLFTNMHFTFSDK